MAARLTAYVVAFIVGVTFIAGLIVGAQRDDDGPVDLIIVNGKVFTGDEGGRRSRRRPGQQGAARRVQSRDPAAGPRADHGHRRQGRQRASGLQRCAPAPAERRPRARSGEPERGVDARSRPARPSGPGPKPIPTHEWIRGRGWLYAPFPNGLPTRQLLDQLVPDRPAYLVSYDGHTGWANTAALEAAGISRRTPNPANGIDREGRPRRADRRPEGSGDGAHEPGAARSPRVRRSSSALRAAVVEANRVGITSVQNAGGDRRTIWSSTTNCAAWATSPCASTRRSRVDASATDRGSRRARRRCASASATIRSSRPARSRSWPTAWWRRGRPRCSRLTRAPATSGEARLTPEDMTRLVAELDGRGWQVMTHAIGDAAVRETLDAVRSRAEVEPRAGRRAPASNRAPRIAGPRGRPAFRDAGRGGQRPARARHAAGSRRSLGGESRSRARRTRLDVRQPVEGRCASGVRVGLAGRAAGPAARHLRRREPHRFRRRARGWLGARRRR